MGFLGTALTAAQRVITAITLEPSLRKVVTYKRFASEGVFDDAKRYPVITYNEVSVGSALLKHTERSISSMGLNGKVQIGDQIYLFEYDELMDALEADMGSTPTKDNISLKDIVNDNGVDKKIKNQTWLAEVGLAVTVIG